tara:strand:- start:257 stop:406 length:150 start_codon:yes stop_codon:yes gene_type:complete
MEIPFSPINDINKGQRSLKYVKKIKIKSKRFLNLEKNNPNIKIKRNRIN